MMDNNSFLKKFEGRIETIGKSGINGIGENLNININDNKPETKKQLNEKLNNNKIILDYNFNHISSIVKEEFNKNKSFIPKFKRIKRSNSQTKNNYNQKSENPIKLIKFIETDVNKVKENVHKVNINNKLDKDNKSIKLPLISSQSKTEEKYILNKNTKLKNIKNYESKNLELIKLLKRDKPIKIKKNYSNEIKPKINYYFQEKNKFKEIYSIFNNKNNKSFSNRNILKQNNSKSDIINKEKSYNNLFNSCLEYRNNKEKIKDKYSKDYNDENKNINDDKIKLVNNKIEKKLLIKKYYNQINNSLINKDHIFNLSKEKNEYESTENNKNQFLFNKKISIIKEENNDKIIENINNNQQNDNFLKILMKQRLIYQTKIPDNSRFKLNPKNKVNIDVK